MKINSYCFQKNNIWYYRKKIPIQLNKKTPLYRISLKKLLGKKSYYTSLLNASVFTITNFINTHIELLFLERETLTLQELNQYVKDLLLRYEEKAIVLKNDYIHNISTEKSKIEDMRFESLKYFSEDGVEYGGHTKPALEKELAELKEAFDTDSIQLNRKKAKDILQRQNIITKEEIAKIPDNLLLEFEKNLVKKEIEVIRQDLSNYNTLMNKGSSTDSNSLMKFLEEIPELKKFLDKSNPNFDDHWELLIEKFLTGLKSKSTAKIALKQFSEVMLGDEKLGVPKRRIMDVKLDDVKEIKEIYKQFPKLNKTELKTMWRNKGILYTCAYTKSEKNKGIYEKNLLGGLQAKIKIILRFLKEIKLYEPEKYGNLNIDLWKKLSVIYSDLSDEDKVYNKTNQKKYLDSQHINSFLLSRYLEEYEEIEGQAKRNFTRHTNSSPHIFWSLALGLFTGARAEELAQLRLRDFEKIIIENEPLYYINLQVTDPKMQSLKNLASERFIPISNYLIEWGFLNYVQERINSKADYLFDLTINKSGKRNGFQKSFNEDIKTHIKKFHPDYNGKLPSFHDLRSHFVSKFLKGKDDDMNKLIEIKKLVGHTKNDLHKDVTVSTYFREPLDIKYAKNLVDNIDFKIDEGFDFIKEMMAVKYNHNIMRDLNL